MYFTSKLYKSVKGISALTGITGSVITIAYGVIQSGGAIFIIGGTLCMTTALFNIVELGKVTDDIDEEIKQLQSYLRGHITRLNELYREYDVNKRYTFAQTRENEILRGLLQKSEHTINEMQLLQQKILAAKNVLAHEAKELREENEALIDELGRLRTEYEREKCSLHDTLAELDGMVTPR